ncbi:MAG: alanine racemase [Chloroflexi bacterium 13_1_40CM_4_68_4]|nr:MAG: alanine racemase [Chloroflexi bacterium 13_1_40CM_4_68_4]
MSRMPLRDSVAEVDLDAIEANVAFLRARAGVPLIAVVKADGYGHGAEAVAPAVLAAGAEMLAVATVEEALLLRAVDIRAPILVFLGAAPRGEARAAADAGLHVAVWRRDQLDALDDAARGGEPIAVHLKVDTGLTRLGVGPDEAEAYARDIARRRRLTLAGVYTHLATADEPDVSFARTQVETFAKLLDALPERPRWQHVLASAGILALAPYGAFTAARPGVALYGLPPAPHLAPGELLPSLRLVSRLARVRRVPAGTGVSYGLRYVADRERVIATVPFGYGDGLPRRASPGGGMLVRGRIAPIVGRVCMDLVMLDVSEVPGAREGDEVVMIGGQEAARRTADDFAREIDTINYEVVTNLHPRVPRVYRRGGKVVGVKTAAGYART